MRRPYERGKIPVVLIHGLWGFPHQWDRMVAELEADPALRGRYQFWTFSYASGDSIPFSAHLLRQSLRRARRLFDPDGTDAAFDRMVVVGHSLGGILAKMMAQDSGSRIWQTVSNRPIDQIVGPPEDCQLLRQAFCYEPVPEVRRLIFIATPHRGSPLVRGLVRDLGTRICDRPSRFREAREALLAQNEPDFFLPGFRGENPTSVGELASGHPLLLALCDLGIDPSVRCPFDHRRPSRPARARRERRDRPLLELAPGVRRLRVAVPWPPHLLEQSRGDPGGTAHPQGTRRNRPRLSDRSRWPCSGWSRNRLDENCPDAVRFRRFLP